MLAAAGTLALYGGTAALALALGRRWIAPVGWRAALLLSAAPLLFTGQAIFTGGILAPLDVAYGTEPLRALAAEHGTGRPVDPLLVDVVSQMLPWRQAVRESLAEGRLPLWNRHVLSGEPLLGVAQPAVLHPATWLGLALPPAPAWNLDLTLRLFLALAAGYFGFRGLGGSELAALLGAAAWAFSDFLVFYLGYPLSPSVAPFPLLVLGFARLVESPGHRAVGLTVAALALAAVAGHPETLLFSVTGAGLVFLAELFAAGPGRRVRPILLALAAGALALGLTAVVLLPVVENLPQTWQHALRNLPIVWGDARSTPLVESARRLLPSLVPYAYGVPGRGGVLERLILPAAYAGSLLLPLAAAGIAAPGRRRAVFVLLAAVGLALNVRLPWIAGPLARLPLFDIAVNDYFVFLSVFGLAGLAVLGADRLSRGEGARAFAWGAAAAVLLVLGVALFRADGLERLGFDGAYFRSRLLLQTIPPLAALLLVGGLAVAGRVGAPAVALLALALVAQRRLEESGVYPTYPESAFYPRLSVLDPIPRGEPVRMTAVGFSFAPNIAAMYGVEDVRGYEAMTLRRYAQTYPLWCTQLPSFFNRVDDATSPWLAFLGVRYVLFPPGLGAPEGWKVLAEERGSRLVENPRALPRAFAPAHVAWLGDPERAYAVTATIQDFARDGVVGAPRPGPLGWLPNGPARIAIAAYDADVLALSLDSEESVFVGTSVTGWTGWRLTIDGKDAPLLPFNHAFVGFQAPAGRHRAVLRYRPDGFVAGAAISAATALLVLALLRRGRPRAPAPAGREPASGPSPPTT
ncbi:MAG TPA: YfhO family protein [Thermoanaerobaculia bacterium]|nr:YfhO family protein [Thermoanaerobaculia bacterium]